MSDFAEKYNIETSTSNDVEEDKKSMGAYTTPVQNITDLCLYH